MDVTEVRLEPLDHEKAKAVGSIVLDGQFVVKDIRVVQLDNLIVAMPSRPMRDKCPKCNSGNAISARFCNHCGGRLGEFKQRLNGRQLFVDLCHPLPGQLRDKIDCAVLSEYARMGGNKCD